MKRKIYFFAIVMLLIFGCLGSSFVRAADPLDSNLFSQRKKLLAADGAEDDLFGCSLSIDGDTMVIGASWDGDSGAKFGAAYIFDRDHGGPENWGQVKKITASGGGAGDRFGHSVAISGDTVVVGAVGDDRNGYFTGAAYVFDRDHGGTDNWGEVKKLMALDGAGGDEFGYSVAISGDTVIVGAHGHESASGSAYIFDRNQGGADPWGLVKKLTASDGAAMDYFGEAVAISGNTAVVGAWSHAVNGKKCGAAYIFDRYQGGTNNWGEVKQIVPSDGSIADFFGGSVSISGNTVVVGARQDDLQTGSAYVYYRDGGGYMNWGQVKKIMASDAGRGKYFGDAICLSGDTLVVGSYGDADNGISSGSAYLFHRGQGGADNWGEMQKILPSDGAAYDYFGGAVGISGVTVAFGAGGDDDKGDSAGSAYVYGPTSCGPAIHVPDEWPTIQMGVDVACPGSTVWVADGTYTGAGNTRVDFKGRAITVRSESGPENCAIVGRGFRFVNGEGPDSVVSGFTIRDGNAQGSGIYCAGASPTIRNCVISGHSWSGIQENGTGVYCANSSATFTDCVIKDNFADWDGGGMALYDASPTLNRCVFDDNLAWTGGALLCVNASPVVNACIFTQNRAGGQGAGMAILGSASSPTLTNCVFTGNNSRSGGGVWMGASASADIVNSTFAGNSATQSDGGGILNGSVLTLTNAIFWGNTAAMEGPQIFSIPGATLTVVYSDIDQAGYGAAGGTADADGNIRLNPAFVDISDPNPRNWDLHLQGASPCIDAGTSDDAPDADMEGNNRQDDPDTTNTGGGLYTYYDMGAYEYIPVIPECEGNFDGDSDVDGSDLALFAAHFGRTDCDVGFPCKGDFDGDNDVDGSDLAFFAADFGRTDCP